MYWKIDRDYLGLDELDIPSRVGTGVGTRLQAEGEILRFRGKDDDGEIYYGGESDDEGLEDAYEFMYRDAGVVNLEVRQPDGTWRSEIS